MMDDDDDAAQVMHPDDQGDNGITRGKSVKVMSGKDLADILGLDATNAMSIVMHASGHDPVTVTVQYHATATGEKFKRYSLMEKQDEASSGGH